MRLPARGYVGEGADSGKTSVCLRPAARTLTLPRAVGEGTKAAAKEV